MMRPMDESGSSLKGVPEMAARLGLRRPVRREGAERYLFLTLVSFAGTVMATRVYLELTGYPRIGGGELHIAHALFGGFFLFAAALLPIVLAGRRVYRMAAVLGGIGIGLFIDEVGKFITTQNDYFYPAAAPLIYATFLLAVLVYLRVRRRAQPDPRSLLLTSLQLMEEAVDNDLQADERDALRYRLGCRGRRGSAGGAAPARLRTPGLRPVAGARDRSRPGQPIPAAPRLVGRASPGLDRRPRRAGDPDSRAVRLRHPRPGRPRCGGVTDRRR